MGTIHTATGNMTEEATARVRAMIVVYRALAGRVFGSPKLSLRTKLRLADTLLWSILFFATATWSACTPTVLRYFNTALCGCCESVRGAGDRTTDAELRAELQVPGIPTLLRRERLRYVARAARAGLPQLSALLQNARVALIMPFAPGRDGSCPTFQSSVQTRGLGTNCEPSSPRRGKQW